MIYLEIFRSTLILALVIIYVIVLKRVNMVNSRQIKILDKVENPEEKIRIKYFSNEIDPIEVNPKGNWVDLRAATEISLKKGKPALIPLGVGMILPKGYEAITAPRSSSFKNFKTMQTNSIGIIDEPYCGDDDQWFLPVIAMEDTTIHVNDRVCQFRIVKHQPKLTFVTVERLLDKNRGGHGSTGVQ